MQQTLFSPSILQVNSRSSIYIDGLAHKTQRRAERRTSLGLLTVRPQKRCQVRARLRRAGHNQVYQQRQRLLGAENKTPSPIKHFWLTQESNFQGRWLRIAIIMPGIQGQSNASMLLRLAVKGRVCYGLPVTPFSID